MLQLVVARQTVSGHLATSRLSCRVTTLLQNQSHHLELHNTQQNLPTMFQQFESSFCMYATLGQHWPERGHHGMPLASHVPTPGPSRPSHHLINPIQKPELSPRAPTALLVQCAVRRAQALRIAYSFGGKLQLRANVHALTCCAGPALAQQWAAGGLCARAQHPPAQSGGYCCGRCWCCRAAPLKGSRSARA